MKFSLWSLVLVACLSISGCGIKKGKTDSDPVSTDSYEKRTDSYEALRKQYEKMRLEYQALIDTSHKLQTLTNLETIQMMHVDTSLSTLSAESEILMAQLAAKPLVEIEMSFFKNVRSATSAALESIGALELNLLQQHAALYANAPNVYRLPEPQREALTKMRTLLAARNDEMLGLRALIRVQSESLISEMRLRAEIQKIKLPENHPGLPAKTIEIKAEEKAFANAGASTVVVRGDKGSVSTLKTEAEVVAYGRANFFQDGAAKDAFQMSSQTGGLTTFAPNAAAVSQSVTDLLAHIKAGMNNNVDDLELAFIIDYSGSMEDDIEGVIKGLVQITNSLEAVRRSGRRVKLAVVTFGEPTKEKVELSFTENLVTVKGTLDRLLSEFKTKQHSVNPGEASYHGLKLALENLPWASKNRRAIVITDEPSHELANPAYGQRFVDNVMKLAKGRGVDTAIYTIVVK